MFPSWSLGTSIRGDIKLEALKKEEFVKICQGQVCGLSKEGSWENIFY